MQSTSADAVENMGPVKDRHIQSSMGPFRVLPEYKVYYPPVVVEALGKLYKQYNHAFAPLVASNLEYPDGYQFCRDASGPANYAVQIDMVGLSQKFLEEVASLDVNIVAQRLRFKIFEIENSLAMYQLLEQMFANGHQSYFSVRYRAALNGLRQGFGRPIALLAVTDQKYTAMMASEFGRTENDQLSDTEVYDLSGFDRFFGPSEFRRYLASNGGRCDYLLYARTSDPVSKLKKPNSTVDHPLLDDSEMRRIIKANTLTFNVDAPSMPYDQRINDTKQYMASMGIAFEIYKVSDFFTSEAQTHLDSGKSLEGFPGQVLSSEFGRYLESQEIDQDLVVSGRTHLRAKPAKGTYGCYGHVRGPLSSNSRFRRELRDNLRQRGGYVTQPEMETPHIVNSNDGEEFTYIDRNFFAMIKGSPVFLGGFRSLMPVTTVEAQKGRIHGNGATVWAEIVA